MPFDLAWPEIVFKLESKSLIRSIVRESTVYLYYLIQYFIYFKILSDESVTDTWGSWMLMDPMYENPIWDCQAMSIMSLRVGSPPALHEGSICLAACVSITGMTLTLTMLVYRVTNEALPPSPFIPDLTLCLESEPCNVYHCILLEKNSMNWTRIFKFNWTELLNVSTKLL